MLDLGTLGPHALYLIVDDDMNCPDDVRKEAYQILCNLVGKQEADKVLSQIKQLHQLLCKLADA